ncbi:MAG TPA: NADH-quinone oxidoreductase subunit M [Pirellulales bacterium]|jgi:NADH-quinone oxidoreductase subunit M|nr:NADH-quinone oxidoreductase subunit M [Pirellulales bacterium]
MHNILLSTILLPACGALVAWLFAAQGKATVRLIALITAGITLALAAHLCVQYWFDQGLQGNYAVREFNWLGEAAKIHFAFGLDGLSVWMFGLSALLTFTAVLVSWEAVKDRPAGFYALLLLLECGMIGVFSARDIVLFYVFFEFTLIPLYFLIGIWGHEERRYAANKFFLFTFTGSVIALLGLIGIVLWAYSASNELTFSIPQLHEILGQHPIPMDAAHGHLQLLIFLALVAGFAVKVPLVPLHTWLPLAHTQAPTGGSIDLAGILLKLGTYGILRFCLPMLPDATAMCMPWILWLAVIGIIYGALVSLVQADLKKLVAYSSVSHMGFVILGFFALNQLSLQGGILQMINHGLSSAGLFAVVGMIYERYHTRQISELGGLAKRTPILAAFMLIFTMSSIGLPGLNGFVGEFMILLGMFQRAWTDAPGPLGPQLIVIAVLAVSGVVLGAWYMLWMMRRVFFGPLHEGHLSQADAEQIHDLRLYEILALAPLAVFIVWIGLYPKLFLKPIAPAADEIIARTSQPLENYYAQKPQLVKKGVAKPQAELRPVSVSRNEN